MVNYLPPPVSGINPYSANQQSPVAPMRYGTEDDLDTEFQIAMNQIDADGKAYTHQLQFQLQQERQMNEQMKLALGAPNVAATAQSGSPYTGFGFAPGAYATGGIVPRFELAGEFPTQGRGNKMIVRWNSTNKTYEYYSYTDQAFVKIDGINPGTEGQRIAEWINNGLVDFQGFVPLELLYSGDGTGRVYDDATSLKLNNQNDVKIWDSSLMKWVLVVYSEGMGGWISQGDYKKLLQSLRAGVTPTVTPTQPAAQPPAAAQPATQPPPPPAAAQPAPIGQPAAVPVGQSTQQPIATTPVGAPQPVAQDGGNPPTIAALPSGVYTGVGRNAYTGTPHLSPYGAVAPGSGGPTTWLRGADGNFFEAIYNPVSGAWVNADSTEEGQHLLAILTNGERGTLHQHLLGILGKPASMAAADESQQQDAKRDLPPTPPVSPPAPAAVAGWSNEFAAAVEARRKEQERLKKEEDLREKLGDLYGIPPPGVLLGNQQPAVPRTLAPLPRRFAMGGELPPPPHTVVRGASGNAVIGEGKIGKGKYRAELVIAPNATGVTVAHGPIMTTLVPGTKIIPIDDGDVAQAVAAKLPPHPGTPITESRQTGGFRAKKGTK